MKSSVKFKTAAEQDIDNIIEMMKDFNSSYDYNFNESLTRDNILKLLKNNDLGVLWLINCNEETAGYAVLSFGFSFEYGGRDAFIDELYIKKDFRSAGLGTLAMEYAEQKAKEFGVNTLHLEVETHNEEGNKLYLKRGFIHKGRTLLSKALN